MLFKGLKYTSTDGFVFEMSEGRLVDSQRIMWFGSDFWDDVFFLVIISLLKQSEY